MKGVDQHALWRALISDRMDAPLTPDQDEALGAHLSICPRCRMVERGYLRAGQLLRALRPVPVPRDLWPRTAAALDIEVARQPRQSRRHRDDMPPHPARSPALMLVAMACLVVAIIAMNSGLGLPAPVTMPRPQDPEVALPTPFQVPTQELAVADFSADGLTIYEATVDQACPQMALDCTAIRPRTRHLLTFHGDRSAASLDMDQPNGRLAVLTTDGQGRETVSVVLLPPYERQPDTGSGPVPGGPTGTLVATPHDPTRPSTTTPEVSPSVRPPGDTPAATPERTDEPGRTGAATDAPASDDPGQATESASGPDPTAAGASPGETPSETGASPLPTTTDAVVSAVLEDVHVVGAPPAWSSDGSVLAFSAMPADGSRGPDVYTWRVGDGAAERLTRDHGSYFASWSASRVVVGRVASGADRSTLVPGSVVIDPDTREQRAVKSAAQWLPIVDPTGRFAVSWFGTLERSERLVSAVEGELYLVDWRAIDPFRADPTPDGQPGSAPEPAASGAEQDASPTLETTPPRSEEPAAASEEAASGSDEVAPPAQDGDPKPAASPPVQVPGAGQALEPARDARLEPVREWQVRWSDDGTAFGFWVSEEIGDSWGRLTVLPVTSETGQLDQADALLSPTLAQRAFSLGLDRVAWVGLSEEGTDGELRLRTWGGGGSGGLRIRQMDLRNGLPAF